MLHTGLQRRGKGIKRMWRRTKKKKGGERVKVEDEEEEGKGEGKGGRYLLETDGIRKGV